MSDSLRDQLLKLGVATEKQARQADKQVRQQRRHHQQPKSARKSVDQALAAKQAEARAAKAARDRELNRQRELDAQAKARWAEIRQLIDEHRVAKPDGYDYFNFQDRGKIRRIPVDSALRERITRCELAIVRCEGRYDLVPAPIADKIRERNERAVVNLADDAAAAPDDQDPYKDYVVPDDLMW